ncbi:coproporphyrinogen III oxidase [Lewinella marina]|uniref:coproporphyrinogen oxidase n=1 Tax=Neolewinella marina TaxID=438751 RepID=A0A2G0CBV0_9BACT|nr:oxygen-dependent coproporphyrinogen oxidase [Neolewinella marina]NJB86644.1 coproporphyrinogen III oxidase [Neolewinella marina]PHK97453.1 oxygen-dependent coproporphyrinogen oxidase [Neolewinella marina]
MPDRHIITEYFRQLQDSICGSLAAADHADFTEDEWDRPGGGGGRARVLLGNDIEKGGVNFSAVHGELPPAAAASLLADAEETAFYATGVSIVLHPRNPHVPIIHMNVRYFELEGGRFWFGGGIDLTPHYIDREQAAWFHQQLRNTCDAFDPAYYPRFKQWADDYFFIPHREETRGVGGIFYDRLEPATEGKTKAELFDFTAAVGETFAPTYLHLLDLNRDKAVSEQERRWQELRRGRYVEFNLVWDRGTKFGLTTNGRTESILMSLPPLAGWTYDYRPEPGSREAETLSLLRKGVDW